MPPLPPSYRNSARDNRILIDAYYTTPTCTLYHGDCLDIMRHLPPRSVNLFFIDPPFNIGHSYDTYEDCKSPEAYLHWCSLWLKECYRLLHPLGTIWIASGIRYQAEIKCLLSSLKYHWRDTVVWSYTFGPNQETKLTPSWVALHYFTKHSSLWTWNQHAIRVPSARQLKYNDKRANPNGKVPDNVWLLLPEEDIRVGLPHMNTWITSRVCGTFKERTAHSAQMPLAILDRIIRLCSNPSDMVGDIMLGSGTTAEASLRNKRSFIGIELSESYLRDICIPRLSGIL